MVQYYTLEEAARLLNTTVDELKLMARKGEVRSFSDRGTMRFRTQEIDELARRRGLGSDLDLPIGQVDPPRPVDSPAPRKIEPEIPSSGGDPGFDFNLDVEDSDQVDIGQELPIESPSGKKGGGSGRKKPGSTKPVAPRAGSDSDVRLVADGSDLEFQISSDSDVKMVEEQPVPLEPVPPPSATRKPTKSTKSGQPDSGVRLIPMEEQSDSDVKIIPDSSEEHEVPLGGELGKTSGDSDIRLQHDSGRKKKEKETPLTEEIDLDAEVRKHEAEKKAKGSSGMHKAVGSKLKLPTTSPFELNEDEAPAKAQSMDSSDDFELTPASEQDQSPLELGTDEQPTLAPADEEVGLGELTGAAGESGINLQEPADGGISLEPEPSSDEIDFELSLDSESTPAPKSSKKKEPDSSGEFELSLDSDEAPAPPIQAAPDSDSEFELSLDEGEPTGGAAPSEGDSDSEFELTLDDSGGLVPIQDDEPAAPAEAEEEKDIFETDFEVPALDDESGSEAMALEEADTDLETSDFDLALNEDDAAAEEPSGSQVVALEEEEEGVEVSGEDFDLEEGAGEFENLDLEGDDELIEDLEAEEEEEAAVTTAAPARWGVLPALMLLPAILVLFVVGLVSWEMINIMFASHQHQKPTGFVAPWLAYDVFGLERPYEGTNADKPAGGEKK